MNKNSKVKNNFITIHDMVMMFNKRLFILVCSLFMLLCGLKSQDNALYLRKANRLLSVAQERNRLASEALEEVKSYRLRLEEDLTDLQDNKKAKAERTKIETEVKGLRKKEEALLQKKKYANNLLSDVTDILLVAPPKRAKYIQEYEKRFGPIILATTNIDVAPDTPPSVETKKADPIAQLESQSANPPPIVENKVIVKEKKKSKKVVKKETKPKSKKEKQPQPPTPSESIPIVSETPVAPQTDIAVAAIEPKTETQSEPKVDIIAPNVSPDVSPRKPKKGKKPTNEKVVKTESSKTMMTYKKYDIKDDVMVLTPASADCNLAFDGMDNFTGKKKQETTPIVLFTHTDDFMRPAMKNKEFVTCEANAIRIEGSRTVYINLTFTILSKDAQRTFGFLDRGAMIIFRFINGKKVTLSTGKTDIGAVDIDKGTTTFRAQLAILETVELTASELDAVRVSWSIGYEDYEIYDMDVLRNLFKCLDKK
jgi:hypothetical protein